MSAVPQLGCRRRYPLGINPPETLEMLDWKTNSSLAGKGATVQQFVAIVGDDRLEAEIAPWGEGRLRINGRDIARIDDAKDRRQAFRQLDRMAVRYLSGQPLNGRGNRRHPS